MSEAEISSSLCFCPIVFMFSYRPLKQGLRLAVLSAVIPILYRSSIDVGEVFGEGSVL